MSNHNSNFLRIDNICTYFAFKAVDLCEVYHPALDKRAYLAASVAEMKSFVNPPVRGTRPKQEEFEQLVIASMRTKPGCELHRVYNDVVIIEGEPDTLYDIGEELSGKFSCSFVNEDEIDDLGKHDQDYSEIDKHLSLYNQPRQ